MFPGPWSDLKQPSYTAAHTSIINITILSSEHLIIYPFASFSNKLESTFSPLERLNHCPSVQQQWQQIAYKLLIYIYTHTHTHTHSWMLTVRTKLGEKLVASKNTSLLRKAVACLSCRASAVVRPSWSPTHTLIPSIFSVLLQVRVFTGLRGPTLRAGL